MAEIPRYDLELQDIAGNSLTLVEDAISVSAARAYNTVGNATLTIPNHYNREWFEYDTRIKIWRTGRSRIPRLFGDTIFFLRKIDNQRSARQYQIECVDAIGILDKRQISYTSETPYADKTLEEFALVTYSDAFRLDNMMKQYVRENFGPDALDALRNTSIIEVERDRNLGPYGEKEASWTTLGAVVSDLASQSAGKGVPLFYDMILQGNGKFQFRVWSTVRGKDRGIAATQPLVFSDESGALIDVHEVDDYTEFANYCYVLGYDKGPSQIVEEVVDDASVRMNPLGRVEFTYTGSDSDVTSVLQDEGKAAIYGRRGIRTVTAQLSEATTLDYGDQYAYGDRVVAQIGGRQYDVQLDAVSASWAGGKDNLDVRLNGSEVL